MIPRCPPGSFVGGPLAQDQQECPELGMEGPVLLGLVPLFGFVTLCGGEAVSSCPRKKEERSCQGEGDVLLQSFLPRNLDLFFQAAAAAQSRAGRG